MGFKIYYDIVYPSMIVHGFHNDDWIDTEEAAWDLLKETLDNVGLAVNGYVVDQNFTPVKGYQERMLKKYSGGLVSNSKYGFKIKLTQDDGSITILPEDGRMYLTPDIARRNAFRKELYERTVCSKEILIIDEGHNKVDQILLV